MQREQAEQVALQALQFIATDADRLERFMALSGLDPSTMRDAATDDSFLSAILEYLMGDERLLVAFATDIDTQPETIKSAWTGLAGYPIEM